ncbi:outer membrane insertion C- signal [Echinicola strongylocentroti]|uniref:Outer membrane insertion C-signal n=1 Tax=Echinicola strongylocentroti TaxID=1795355 RepID=A0A2Z4INP1_9BACT|nr:outer membrane insertion C- signal [Echinicola strongylocentroti]AWW32464.1 outer membrane insertion C- signal [Echinicola strongylocentroti]
MKKLLLVFTVFLISYGLQAQEVGVRFGEGANNVAIDGIFSIGEFSRVHGDISFGDGVGLDLLYDFLYRPFPDADGLDWYVGAGPSFYFNDPFFFGVSGEIGLEYHFDFPLAVGLDWRPTFWIVEDTDFNANYFGLNVRYVIGR